MPERPIETSLSLIDALSRHVDAVVSQIDGRETLTEEELRAFASALKSHVDGTRETSRHITLLLAAMGRLGVFAKNYQSGEVLPNGLWYGFGYERDEMQGNRWMRYVHPDDVPRLQREMKDQLHNPGGISQSVYRMRDKAGNWHWILSKGVLVSRTVTGQPEWYMGADFDITTRVQAEERAREARQMAEEKALEAQSLVAATAIIASSLDWEEAIQRVLDQAASVVPNDIVFVALMLEDTIRVIGGRTARGKMLQLGETAPLANPNPFTWVANEKRPLSVRDLSDVFPEYADVSGVHVRSWLGVPLVVGGSVMGCLAFARHEAGHYTADHTRLAAAFGDHVAIALTNAKELREARQRADTDLLTRALSRQAFISAAHVAYEHCTRVDLPFSLVMIDLDHFKRVNDTYGHPAGDEVLRQAADGWRDELRDSDLLGRYGGEEFILALPATPGAAASRIAERLRRRLTTVRVGEHTMSASFGVACSHSSGDPGFESLLKRADAHLYEAKNSGRNRVVADQ